MERQHRRIEPETRIGEQREIPVRRLVKAGFGQDEPRTVGIQLQHIGSLNSFDETPHVKRHGLPLARSPGRSTSATYGPRPRQATYGRREIVRLIEKIGLVGRIDILRPRVQS